MGRFARIAAAAFGPGSDRSPEWFERDVAAPGAMVAADRFGPSESMSFDRGWMMRSIGGGLATNSSVVVNEASSLRTTTVYACVNRIANPIASFPIRIYRAKPGGGSEIVTDHPLSTALGLRPNPRMSSRTARKTLMLGALLWGNGYWEIERNNGGQAVGLWPLLPDRTTPRLAGDQIVYRTNIAGRTHEIPQDDVVHIMDQSHDGLIGMSQIGLAREAVGLAQAMETFGGKFFANDAKSGGFLMHPGKLGAQAHTNLRGQTPGQPGGRPLGNPDGPGGRLEVQGGLDNAHRVKVLEEGMKFITTTIPPEDAQFLGSREFQIAEIARMFDVPLILLQSQEKTSSWGSGIEQLMIGFVSSTVGPWVVAIEQELNWKLFTPDELARGYFVKLSMQSILRGDSAARAAFYKDMFGVGAMSPNKILALEDEEGIGPDGDRHFVPANFMPLDQADNPRVKIGANGGPAIDEEEDAA